MTTSTQQQIDVASTTPIKPTIVKPGSLTVTTPSTGPPTSSPPNFFTSPSTGSSSSRLVERSDVYSGGQLLKAPTSHGGGGSSSSRRKRISTTLTLQEIADLHVKLDRPFDAGLEKLMSSSASAHGIDGAEATTSQSSSESLLLAEPTPGGSDAADIVGLPTKARTDSAVATVTQRQ